MIVDVRVIPHKDQRYETVGDWFFTTTETFEKVLNIRVSEVFVNGVRDEYMEQLIAVHEIVEALLCHKRGIPEDEVTKFDVGHPELDDPGSSPDAPYYREHMFATSLEMQLAHQLDIKWKEYNNAVEAIE